MHPLLLRNRAIEKIQKYFLLKNFHQGHSNLLVTSAAIEPYLDALAIDELPFVLPTSPEFALKKLLALEEKSCPGVFEIAHAFRKEQLAQWHNYEFTMVEWYHRNKDFMLLTDDVLDLIHLINPADVKLTSAPDIFTVTNIFEQVLHTKVEADWGYKEYLHLAKEHNIFISENREVSSEIEKEIFSSELFNLLFDEKIVPELRADDGIVFICDFPVFSRGLSKLSPNGWSKRIECYIHGIEIANGYQELSDATEIRELWQKNNEIRIAQGKPAHPIDEYLLSISSQIEGSAGMALGLERLLMVYHDIDNINNFSW